MRFKTQSRIECIFWHRAFLSRFLRYRNVFFGSKLVDSSFEAVCFSEMLLCMASGRTPACWGLESELRERLILNPLGQEPEH